jgi:hypothetical protein
MFGAVVGVSEADEYLIRLEAVQCILEVKRSIGGDTVKKMQDHAKDLSTSFLFGGKQVPWMHWGVAFTADRSRDAILKNLNDTYDPPYSIGALLVLDTEPPAEELKGSARQHLNLTDPGQSGRGSGRPRVTGASVKGFIEEVTAPRGAFFVRDSKNKTYRVFDEIPNPLLAFTMMLEDNLKRSPDVSNLQLRDFFPSIVADDCVARIRAAGGKVEIDDKQVTKPVVQITVAPGMAINDVASKLRLFGNVKSLVLASTNVADADLVHISNLKELQVLSLAITSITDAGLKHLGGLKALQEIDLTGAKVSEAGIDELKKSIPNLRVLQ